jgi:hypothetical protein
LGESVSGFAILLMLFRETNAERENIKEAKPDHPAGNFNPYAGQRALYFGF